MYLQGYHQVGQQQLSEHSMKLEKIDTIHISQAIQHAWLRIHRIFMVHIKPERLKSTLKTSYHHLIYDCQWNLIIEKCVKCYRCTTLYVHNPCNAQCKLIVFMIYWDDGPVHLLCCPRLLMILPIYIQYGLSTWRINIIIPKPHDRQTKHNFILIT